MKEFEYQHCNGNNFDFLIGKSIIDVKETNDGNVDCYTLICDDKTKIKIEMNAGCGGCGNGWSEFDDLIKLKENKNAITNVICKYRDEEDSWGEPEKFELFIFYDNGDINRLSGNEGYGNGYYGGGYYVTIKSIEEG